MSGDTVAKGRVVGLTSGGKDSILAFHLAVENGYEPVGLLTLFPDAPDSMLYHSMNLEVVGLISESMGQRWYSFHCEGVSEEEALLRALNGIDCEVVSTGGISSAYQRTRFERAASLAGKASYSPLWGLSGREVYSILLEHNFDVVVVSVAALGLGREWLGRHLDGLAVERLLNLSQEYRFNPTGEGGEMDSLVLDAPLYRSKLVVLGSEVEWWGDSGLLRIKKIDLESKD